MLTDLADGLGLSSAMVNAVELVGQASLPGAFRVADAAAASVGTALAAAADWLGARTVRLDVADAAGVFLADRRLRIDGQAPLLWDPVAGDYPVADGWVRLHTNYAWHRAAALGALGLPLDAERAAVAAALADRSAQHVEAQVQAAGGAAAALRTQAQWQTHPQAAAIGGRRLVALSTIDAASTSAELAASGSGRRPSPGRPLRVLDVTRVIAGPTATKILAAFGADVLRLDPPGFEELLPLVADTTGGKRCARLHLAQMRDTFAELLAAADVLVCGLRPGALTRLGWPEPELRAVNPSLVLAELSAYGDTGPWAGRRGFDSLVQMVTGIAAEGMHRAGADHPVPLPAQALDHSSGWLLAAGILAAVTARAQDGNGRRVSVVLARTAQWLDSLGRQQPPGTADNPGRLEEIPSALGKVSRLACPGEIDHHTLRWGGPPTLLGTAPPTWAPAPQASR